MYIIQLTKTEVDTLEEMLTNKAKEIHAWRISVKNHARDTEYEDITNVLMAVRKAKGGN